MFSYAIWITLLVILGRLIYRKILHPWDDTPSIPGPAPKLLVGNLLDIIKEGSVEAVQLKYLQQYGPVFKMCFPMMQMITVGDPKVMRGMLANHKSPMYETVLPLVKNGLVTTEDEQWRHSRKLLDQAFSFRYLRGLHSIITRHTHEVIDKWNKTPLNCPINVSTDFTNYTFDIIGDVALNTQFNAVKSCNQIDHPVLVAFRETTMAMAQQNTAAWNKLNVFANRRIKKNVQIIKAEALKKVAERRLQHKQSTERRNDILDILLSTDAKSGKCEFNDDDIVDHVNTFLFAGHDTTSVALAMTFFTLGQNRHVLEKCLAELEVLRGKDFVPSYDDLRQLRYLEMVFSETLRLHPPGSTAREFTKENMVSMGVDPRSIQCNTFLHLSSYVSHVNPEHWDNPLEFKPDRFEPDSVSARDPLAFIPFMAGPRKCIGKNLALMEAKTALAMLLPRFRFSLVEGHDIRWGYQMISKPLNGVRIVIEKSSCPHL